MLNTRALSLIVAVGLLTGCCRQRLVVETEYVTERSLASYWVRTPDPHKNCPSTGQRLIITWRVPACYLGLKDPHIELTVRFGDDEEDEVCIALEVERGAYIYEVLDDDYWDHCGIATYKAELVADDCVKECWEHQLWAEYIRFDDPCEDLQ
jgi:hypothetical protein